MSEFKNQVQKIVSANLAKKFSYKNIMEAPKIEKIVLNMVLVRQFLIRKF